MINMRNHRHVADVSFLVHHGTDLIYGEVHLEMNITLCMQIQEMEAQS